MGVSVFTSLEQLPEALRRQLGYERQGNLFLSLEWFRCLGAHACPQGLTPRIYVVGAGDRPAFVLYCLADAAKRRLFSLTNFYSMDYAGVALDDPDNSALDELAAFLGRERPRWVSVNLHLIADEAARGRLKAALARHAFWVNEYFQFENFHHAVAGRDFETYYAERPSRVRNTIKRKEKKLEKELGYNIVCTRQFDAQLMADYALVYASSWKPDETYPDFIREMCRMAAQLGLLRMGVLYVGGKPAAAQFWLLSEKKAIIYKLAYDEAFKDYSVGSILTRRMASYVLDGDSVDELDYGIGSDAYKKEWMDSKRDIYGLEAFNMRSPTGAAHGLAWKLWSKVKPRPPSPEPISPKSAPTEPA